MLARHLGGVVYGYGFYNDDFIPTQLFTTIFTIRG